jgi:hypothetical protein
VRIMTFPIVAALGVLASAAFAQQSPGATGDTIGHPPPLPGPPPIQKPRRRRLHRPLPRRRQANRRPKATPEHMGPPVPQNHTPQVRCRRWTPERAESSLNLTAPRKQSKLLHAVQWLVKLTAPRPALEFQIRGRKRRVGNNPAYPSSRESQIGYRTCRDGCGVVSTEIVPQNGRDWPTVISGPHLSHNPGADRAFFVTIRTSHCAIKSK